MGQVHARATETRKRIESARRPNQAPSLQNELELAQSLVPPQAVCRRAQIVPDAPSPADMLALQRTVGNRRVQGMLERHSGKRKSSQGPVLGWRVAPVIQRFEGAEHEQLGNRGTGNATTDLDIGGGRMLTFGEMAALAGDWFESLSQMRTLSGTTNGQQQLQWVRWKGLGGRGPEPSVSSAVKTACMNRYYNLAAGNVSHFSAGGTAGSAYRTYHRDALWKAFQSGATPIMSSMTEARTTEAFGSHFLNDMFSSGHVRTPRVAQRAWYQAHHPNSIKQIVDHMARVMHGFLVREHPVLNFLGQIPSRGNLATQIRTLGGPALNAMSLGDLVSIAYHDRDNVGLAVISELNHYGAPVPGGFRWNSVGDSQLGSPAGYYTRTMATRAVQASMAELNTLEQAGQSVRSWHLTLPELRARFRAEVGVIQFNNQFQAERYIPRVVSAGGNVTMDWQWGAFNAEMRTALDGVVKGAIATELATKSAQLRASGATSDRYASDALNEVIRRLRNNGIKELETAIGSPAGPSAGP